MPAPLSDVLSASAASPRRASSVSPRRTRRSSPAASSSALGLVWIASPESVSSDQRQSDWTATDRSPFQPLPMALQNPGHFTGLGLGFAPTVLPTDDSLTPPWSIQRRVSSEGKPSPDALQYETPLHNLYDDSIKRTQRQSSSTLSVEGNGDTSGTDLNSVSRRPRILMTVKQTAHLNALWTTTYFPNTAEREQLAQLANLTPRQVQVWFQNQRQKQRRVLHDPAASLEEKVKLDDLRHSPRTRRRLTLQAARMEGGNDYMTFGLAPLSPFMPRPSPPVRSHSHGQSPHPYHPQHSSAVSSREYVPPKAIVSRMSMRPFGQREIYRVNTEPYPPRRTSSVSGWQRDNSPPRTASGMPPLYPRERFEEEDDRRHHAARVDYGPLSPPASKDRPTIRLPPISSLDLPPIDRSVPRPSFFSTPAGRVPSFATLLNAM